MASARSDAKCGGNRRCIRLPIRVVPPATNLPVFQECDVVALSRHDNLNGPQVCGNRCAAGSTKAPRDQSSITTKRNTVVHTSGNRAHARQTLRDVALAVFIPAPAPNGSVDKHRHRVRNTRCDELRGAQIVRYDMLAVSPWVEAPRSNFPVKLQRHGMRVSRCDLRDGAEIARNQCLSELVATPAPHQPIGTCALLDRDTRRRREKRCHKPSPGERVYGSCRDVLHGASWWCERFSWGRGPSLRAGSRGRSRPPGHPG